MLAANEKSFACILIVRRDTHRVSKNVVNVWSTSGQKSYEKT